MGKKGCLWVVLRMKTSDQSERNSRPGRLSPRGKRAPPPADKYYQVVQEGDTTEAHNAAQLKVSPQGEVREVVAQDTVQANHAGRCCWHQQATRPARLAGSFHQSQGWFSARPPPAGPPAPALGADGLVQTWPGASWESLASCHQLLLLVERLLRFCLELQRVDCVRTRT